MYKNIWGQNHRNKNIFVLYLVVLITGSCGLAYEYTISKVASDLLGNSTRQWAMIIGLMMFFMGFGANYQKFLKPSFLFSWFVLLELLLSLLGGLSPILLLWAYVYWKSHYVLWQYILIATIGFLIGLEIPILTRINEKFTPELKINIGRTLQMDYVGALFGAILWSYWLIPYLPLSQAAVIISFANLVATWLFMSYFYHRLRWRSAIWIFSIFVHILLIGTFIMGTRWSWHIEQGLYRDPIVFSKTTVYQHLVLTESARPRSSYFAPAKENTEYRLYINGNLQFSSLDEFIYHENLVHPAFALFYQQTGRFPRRVLILGGGDGLALREVRKYPAIDEIILCDIDSEMLRLAAEYPILRKLNQNALNGNLSIASGLGQSNKKNYYLASDLDAKKNNSIPIIKIEDGKTSKTKLFLQSMDAMNYIKKATGLFDIIIADFPDPNSEALSKLYSLSFYHNVKQKLAEGGIFVQQATSPVYAYKAFWSIGRTMMAAGLETLPYRDFIPSFGEWGWWLARAARPERKTLRQVYQNTNLERSNVNLSLRYLSNEIMQANIIFPAVFQSMYDESLVLLYGTDQKGEKQTKNSAGKYSGGKEPHRAKSAESAEFAKFAEFNLGELYSKWVTTYSQNRVYQYYLEASWE